MRGVPAIFWFNVSSAAREHYADISEKGSVRSFVPFALTNPSGHSASVRLVRAALRRQSTVSKSASGANGPDLSIIKLVLNLKIHPKRRKNISLSISHLHAFRKKSFRQMAQNAFSPP